MFSTLNRIAALARGATNTLAQVSVYKIHPSIGIARVGNAPAGDFFTGPEVPGRSAHPPGGNFKNSAHQIRKQAARFRIFEYKFDTKLSKFVPVEITIQTPEIQSIEWTVHLANRKASYYEFQGRTGFPAPPNPGRKRRNDPRLTDAAERETKLDIDPGPKTITASGGGGGGGGVTTDTIHTVQKGEYLSLIASKYGIPDWHTIYNHPKNAAFKASHPDPNLIFPGDKLFIPVAVPAGTSGTPSNAGPSPAPATSASFTNPKASIPIPSLGEIRLDSKGRLLVLGPDGIAASSKSGAPAPITTYANNDEWFDDVSDGPVTARIKLKASGRVIDVIGAWVIVVPPDFAPPIGNVISLYDRLYDVAIQSGLPAFAVPPDNAVFDGRRLKRYRDRKKSGSPSAYKPSYTEEIYPLLKATVDAQWVHGPANPNHFTLDFDVLSKADKATESKRKAVFGILRKPGGIGGGSMPKLLGDEGEKPGDPLEHLALTQTQFEFMENWANGNFIEDWPGSPPSEPAAQEEGIQPEDLDCAALENCCGGAFYPGIEAGWLIQNAALFFEPFRIKHGTVLGNDRGVTYKVGPGFFTQQMALPWQADFHDCKTESHADGKWGWWPGQRPDDVFTPASPATLVPWFRGLSGGGLNGREHMIRSWATRGFVIKVAPDKYAEREGPP